MEILLRNQPIDTLILSQLNNIGFKKIEISKMEYDKIRNIYCKPTNENDYATEPCGFLNKDILFFKKYKFYVGVSVIDFSCGLIQVWENNQRLNSGHLNQSSKTKEINTLLSKYY